MRNDHVLTLHLTRATAHAAIAALRKLPIEVAEAPHAELLACVQAAEHNEVMAQILANLTSKHLREGADGDPPPGT